MISIDSTLDLSVPSSSVTHNISFNNVAGDFMLVSIVAQNAFNGQDIVSITYNGVALTKVDDQQVPNHNSANVWRLSNPATGSNTLSVTLSATGGLYGAVQTYTGVDLLNPIDATNKGTSWNLTTALSLPITTVSDNAFLFASVYIARNVTTYGTNTSQVSYSAGTYLTVRSTNNITPAGATTLSWTASSTEFAGWVIVALKPDTGGPPPASQNSNFLKLF